MTETADSSATKHEHDVDISVDGETYVAPTKEMTADDILRLAGIDASENYLVEKHGRQQVSYQGKGTELIKLHERETFISVPTGDVTVS
jgi:hypothetical protein